MAAPLHVLGLQRNGVLDPSLGRTGAAPDGWSARLLGRARYWVALLAIKLAVVACAAAIERATGVRLLPVLLHGVAGYAGGRGAAALGQPPLIGMLVSGVAARNALPAWLGTPDSMTSGALRGGALALIMLRAGLALEAYRANRRRRSSRVVVVVVACRRVAARGVMVVGAVSMSLGPSRRGRRALRSRRAPRAPSRHATRVAPLPRALRAAVAFLRCDETCVSGRPF